MLTTLLFALLGYGVTAMPCAILARVSNHLSCLSALSPLPLCHLGVVIGPADSGWSKRRCGQTPKGQRGKGGGGRERARRGEAGRKHCGRHIDAVTHPIWSRNGKKATHKN